MNEPIRTQRTGRTSPIDSFFAVLTLVILVSAIPLNVLLWRIALS